MARRSGRLNRWPFTPDCSLSDALNRSERERRCRDSFRCVDVAKCEISTRGRSQVQKKIYRAEFDTNPNPRRGKATPIVLLEISLSLSSRYVTKTEYSDAGERLWIPNDDDDDDDGLPSRSEERDDHACGRRVTLSN